MLLQDGFAKICAESSIPSHMEHPWPREGVIDLLVQRSSGQFIYAATVLKFVGANFWNPTKQLALVLKSDPTAFSDFEQLYIKILSAYPSTKNIVQVLGIFVAFDEEDLTPEVIEEIIKMEESELKLVQRDLSLMDNENGKLFGNLGDLRRQGQDMLVGKLIEMLRRRRPSGGIAGRPRPIEGLAKPVDDARKNLPTEGIPGAITAVVEGTTRQPRPVSRSMDDARKDFPTEGIPATVAAEVDEGTAGRRRPILARPVDDARKNIPTEGIAATITAGVEGTTGRLRPRRVDDARKDLPTEGIPATVTAGVEGTAGRPRPILARPVDDARKNIPTEGIAATITAGVEGTTGQPRPITRRVDDARKDLLTEGIPATIAARVEGTAGRPRPFLARSVDDARKNIPTEGIAATITAGVEGTAGRPRPALARPVDDARKNLPTEGMTATITAGVEGSAGRLRPASPGWVEIRIRPADEDVTNVVKRSMPSSSPSVIAASKRKYTQQVVSPTTQSDDKKWGKGGTKRTRHSSDFIKPSPFTTRWRKKLPTEGIEAPIAAGVEGTAGRPKPAPVDDARKNLPIEGMTATITTGVEGSTGRPKPASSGWVEIRIGPADENVTNDVKRSMPSSSPPPVIADSK